MYHVFAGLGGEHDWRLVVLAGIVCLLASLAAVSLFRRARAARLRRLAARSEPVDGTQRQLSADTDEKLHERNVFLDAALNNMTQGLCMFDADERIVVLNRRFLEMYK